jgi:hypothetical protein
LERTYRSTNCALVDEVDAARMLLRSMESITASGQDGVLHTHEHLEYNRYLVQEYVLESREKAVQALRQSFLLMIYHFWEKQVSKWAGCRVKPKKGESEHDAYLRHCKIEGIAAAINQMNELRYLVNLIKHGHGKQEWGDKLYEERKDFFEVKYISDDPYEYLKLEDHHVLDFVAVVRSSGPTSSSHFVPIRLRQIEGKG